MDYVDLPSNVFCVIHLSTREHFHKERPTSIICDMCSEITLWNLLPHLLEANALDNRNPRTVDRIRKFVNQCVYKGQVFMIIVLQTRPYVDLYWWWRHQMETFSALLAICARNSPAPLNSPHRGQWRGALTFPLICVGINGRNTREAGDLGRYCANYDVSIM